MTEKRFAFQNQEQHLNKIYDTEKGRVVFDDELCDLLNEQHETIQRLKENIDELLSVNVEEELLKENEQLRKDATTLIYSNQEYRKENEQLKSDVYDWKASAEDYLKLGKSLKKENEQLKKGLNDDLELIGQLQKENNELKVKASSWKITASEEMMKQAEIKEENEQLKQQIKDLRIDVLDSIHEAYHIKCNCSPCVVEECVKKVIE